jgi:hypothetical protein
MIASSLLRHCLLALLWQGVWLGQLVGGHPPPPDPVAMTMSQLSRWLDEQGVPVGILS